MKTVGEFNDQDADVGSKSNHEAKKIVAGFREISVDVAHTRAGGTEFRHAVNEKGDGFAKFVFNVFKSDGSVFDSVVEGASDDCVFVHAPFGEDFFHSKRMVDEGFATFSKLTFVGVSSKFDSFFNSLGFHEIIITLFIGDF